MTWDLAICRSGNGVCHISEVTLRRARLVLRWVTIRGYTIFVIATQGNSVSYPKWDGKWVPAKRQRQCCAANYMSGIAQAMHDIQTLIHL